MRSTARSPDFTRMLIYHQLLMTVPLPYSRSNDQRSVRGPRCRRQIAAPVRKVGVMTSQALAPLLRSTGRPSRHIFRYQYQRHPTLFPSSFPPRTSPCSRYPAKSVNSRWHKRAPPLESPSRALIHAARALEAVRSHRKQRLNRHV